MVFPFMVLGQKLSKNFLLEIATQECKGYKKNENMDNLLRQMS